MAHRLLALLLSIALTLPAAAAGADEKERYAEWRGDAAESTEESAAQALVRTLEALIDEAERARAADPRFLQDLRDAIAAHAPRAALIRDDFSDGDFTLDPRWTVASGDFSVDPRLGLRTVVPVAGADAAGESEGGLTGMGKSALDAGKSVLDAGKDVVGGVLDAGKDVVGDLLGEGEGEQDAAREEREENAEPPAPEPAEIYLSETVGDAFALEITLAVRSAAEDARFEIDLFQGETRGAGYRLSYLPGGDPALVLARFGRRGVTALGAHDGALTLDDGHVLGLTRDAEGAMIASVDGAGLIRAESRAPAGPFDGIALVNGGGDYAIREIAVYPGPR